MTTAPISKATGVGICSLCSAVTLASGDSLTATFNQTVSTNAAYTLALVDGAASGDSANITPADSSVSQSSSGGLTNNVVTWTLTSTPIITHGGAPFVGHLE